MAESVTVNTQLLDAFTRRQLRTSRVATGLWRQVWSQVALLETELLGALKAADPLELATVLGRQRAVHRLIETTLTPLITARYQQIAGLMADALLEVADAEARASVQAVHGVLGPRVLTTRPTARQLRAAVLDGLFPAVTRPTDASATHADWWQRQAQTLTQRLADQLRVSAALGESLQDTVRRLRGTVESAFRDGLMDRARQSAERLVRTSVQHAVTQAREAVASVNASEQFVLIHSSILDEHTCLIHDTLLRTPEGMRPIGTVAVGDIVVGGSGVSRRVYATHRRMTHMLARLTLSDGTVVVCTPDHRFLTEDSGWVEAQQLKENTVLRVETML
jgi:hypothetical protein